MKPMQGTVQALTEGVGGKEGDRHSAEPATGGLKGQTRFPPGRTTVTMVTPSEGKSEIRAA